MEEVKCLTVRFVIVGPSYSQVLAEIELTAINGTLHCNFMHIMLKFMFPLRLNFLALDLAKFRLPYSEGLEDVIGGSNREMGKS